MKDSSPCIPNRTLAALVVRMGSKKEWKSFLRPELLTNLSKEQSTPPLHQDETA
jgi:hypothetical protein